MSVGVSRNDSTSHSQEGGGGYRCAVAPAVSACPADELAVVAAMASAETAARLRREIGVRVVTGAGATELAGWPPELRRLDGQRARAAVRALSTHGAALLAEDHLLVVLDGEPWTGPPAVPPTPATVTLSCALTAGRIEVTATCPAADPWRRGLPAVAEVFAEVLRALLADPAAAPAAVPGIGAASRERTLRRYAGAAVDTGEFRAVPDLIEERVDRGPDRPAVSFGERRLTYRQLDRLANGLAATLAAGGVRRGDVVPVVLADGLELPLAYLALMKLGAAFVPFDPAWPEQRIRAALDVLAPGRVLCASAGRVPDGYRPVAVEVAVDRITPSDRRPGVALGPDDLIYGIFTSGTTGVPKCAMNRHEGLTNRFRFMSRYFRATGEEVVLQNSRHTFDSSVWQLFWPLTTGGRVVVPAQGEFLNLEHTIATISAERITVTDFVPSIFNVMVSIVDRDPRARAAISSLRHLIVGGEEINPLMVHRLREFLPGIGVTNGYGPTEASIGMVFHPVDAADGDLIPLGRPIDNCYAAVVDPDLRPLPAGATGEIVIGGVCLGAGYAGSPGRTAEVFVPNPLPELPGDRLYRTGDLGWYDADGRLHFAGRSDFQVKVNGVRIELGEIETTAERCPGVQQAKVLVARRGGGSALALFVAADDGVTDSVVLAHLRRTLPRISLPRYCFVLAEMPLTDNGKVDRRQLGTMLDRRLAEDAVRLTHDDEPTALVQRVLRVFRTTLGRPELTEDDDFLSSGGDSIQALRTVVSLTAACGVELGVQDLYAQPTAAGMARLIDRWRAAPEPAEEESTVLERDAAVPAGLAVRPAEAGRPVRTVLVTGATGFVGSRLVHQLLATTDLTVLCGTRAPDDATATDRVVRALVERGLWRPEYADRLTGYAADLAQPALGLDQRVWQHLARTADLILHNGALVNFLFDYRAHRPANVYGTAELLRLAMAHRPAPVHYVSTLGVLDREAERHANPLSEQYELDCAVMPTSGYSRSKWVAERYLAEARRRGATVTVLRLGEVMPAADNGHPNHRALTHLLLSTFDRLGMCPAAAIRSDYTPVDYVAARVVAAVTDPEAWGRTHHVFHPESVCFADVLSRVGTPIARVSCLEFLDGLREAAGRTGDRELTTLLSLLPPDPPADEAGLRRMFSGLLVDNPRLFRKDQCRSLEQRWGLTDDWLYAPIAAYRERLAADGAVRAPAEGRLLLPAGNG